MLVYFIRHGETDLNKRRCLQGKMDIKLNERGIKLAKETAEALKDIRFDKIISSPLSRAYDTARIVAGERDVEIVFDERIREISFGEYEGYSYGGYEPAVPDPDFIYFFVAPQKYKVPEGGESFAEVIKRTGEFWREVSNDPEYKEKTLLISTHGCALKGILANIRGTEPEDFWGDGVHKNCAVTLVKVSEEGAEVVYEGKTLYQE